MRTLGNLRLLAGLCLVIAALILADQAWGRHLELPGAVLEPAPYNVQEAAVFPPPYESTWTGQNNPGVCAGCHGRIFGEWNGSMMGNSWRDPVWRAAFFLLARATATDGNCDTPNPPDGTTRNLLNPFANANCTSTFDLGTQTHTTSGSGSLLDEFCSRCHMPTNYADNVATDGSVDSSFDPTSDNGTSWAFATLSSQYRNTSSGKLGIFCKTCHSMTGSRYTPYHNYEESGTEYVPAVGTSSRSGLLPLADEDLLDVADANSPNLGYRIGAGAYSMSPHAINYPERFGPLTFNNYTSVVDTYVSDVFNIQINYEQKTSGGMHMGGGGRMGGHGHDGYYTAFMERAEWCGLCHDVTNPLPIMNPVGNWTGGFPIERTYTEYRNSAYADRPGNTSFDPSFKRDCQTCHMQQHYGQPGTAQTLYANGEPVAPLTGSPADSSGQVQVFYSHHFVGGNAYITDMIGATAETSGGMCCGGGGGGMGGGSAVASAYPELSRYSFSSADSQSPYAHAVWDNVGSAGLPTQHSRMAWDRLRNALDVTVTGPASASAGTTQPLTVTVANTGCGHNFPTGFPEGRVGWVALRAWDTNTGTELQIFDSFWNRTTLGVGYLTQGDVVDPNFPGCNWHLPEGSPDPYAVQFKAVASLGDGCPTLALPYATPLNLVTNAQGLPVDQNGTVINGSNPLGLPQYSDLDGDGELFDDAYLVDSRLRPRPHADSSRTLDRYSVVIPAGTVGPVAVTAQVYYQSVEAIVALEFLGNMADTDQDHHLEPCTLGGSCDGRTASSEPAVVEGAPPVPMAAASWVIDLQTDNITPSQFFGYPSDGATGVYQDVVPKIGFSEPVVGIDDATFTLTDAYSQTVPTSVAQVSDGVWALFPDQIFLSAGSYTARVKAPICDTNGNCLSQDIVWSFTVGASGGSGNTIIPLGFN